MSLKIELRDETQTLILSNEELDNTNFVDLELFDEQAKDKDNPRGFVSEYTAVVEDLKLAVDAFWQKKMSSEKMGVSTNTNPIKNPIPCDHNFQILSNGSSYCGICEARKLKERG